MVQPATLPIDYGFLAAPSVADWDAIETILARSFAPEDIDPPDALRAWVASGEMLLAVARARADAGRIVGLGTLKPLVAWNGYCLGYLAVDPGLRGQGVGEGLFHLLGDYLREHGAQCMIWEVHPPDPADPAAFDSRRVRFYERLGGRLIPGSEVVRPAQHDWPRILPLPPDVAAGRSRRAGPLPANAGRAGAGHLPARVPRTPASGRPDRGGDPGPGRGHRALSQGARFDNSGVIDYITHIYPVAS